MREQLLITFAIASFTLHAQTGSGEKQMLIPSRSATHPAAKEAALGDQYYLETFDEDLNGWTTNTQQGVVDWKWTNEGPGPTSSFYAVPPLNTAGGWLIIDDDHDGYPGHVANASIISPVIDLSGAPSQLKLQFDQYYQEYQVDHCYVGVSTNGGLTWNEVEINEGVGRDNRPNPETRVINISAWVAPDPSNVKIRFRYTADWSYGWQVDNVGIYEPAPYELVMEQAMVSHTDNEVEYSRIPASQMDGQLRANGRISNSGSLPLTDVQVSVVVKDAEGNTIGSGNSDAFSLQPWDTLSVQWNVTLMAPGEGIHSVEFMATSAEHELDAMPENNTLVRRIEIQEGLYGMDGLGVHEPGTASQVSIGTNTFEDAQDELYLMNLYSVGQPITVHGIQFQVDPSSEPGSYVFAALLDPQSVLSDQVTGALAESPIRDISQEDIDGGTVNVVFPEPVVLEGGEYYAAIVLHSVAGASHIKVVDDTTVPRPTLAAVIHVSGDGTYNNGNAYAIRLILDPSLVSVPESEVIPVATLFPNPATGVIHIRAGDHPVQYRLMDATGAIIRSGRSAGDHTMDLSTEAAGIYMLRLQGDFGIQTLRIIKE